MKRFSQFVSAGDMSETVKQDMVKAIRRRGWRRRILAALKHGKFTKTDRALSKQWPSCALGEAALYRGLRPDDVIGADDFVKSLGMSFMNYVYADDPRGAQMTLERIRERIRNVF